MSRIFARIRGFSARVPSAARDDRGSALIEFAFLGVLLSIPLLYLIVTLARLQAGAYAVTTAAREAVRAYVTSPQPALAAPRAQAASRLAFADQGFADGSVAMSRSGGACLSRGSQVRSDATLQVQLPLIPGFLRAVLPTDVTRSATHTETVDTYGAGR